MTTKGVEAEIAAQLAAEGVDQAELGQLDLDLFADMPSPVEQAAEARGVVRRGPGRPAGAKNRRTADMVRLIKATKRPTLLALKEWADLPLDEFAAVSGIKDPAQAFAAWFRIAELVTAYEEGRPTQRVEVEANGAALPVLVIGSEPVRPDLAHGNPPTAGELLNVTDFKVVEEKQPVSDFTPVEVSQE